MAEVMAAEERAARAEPERIADNALVLLVSHGVGRIVGLRPDGFYVVALNCGNVVMSSQKWLFALPEPLKPLRASFSIDGGRA